VTVAGNESCSDSHPVSFKDALLDVDQLRRIDFPERKIILNPWLYDPSLTMVAGMRGVGKSWFGESLVDSVSRGVSLGPWQTINSVPCLYVDGEMAIQETRERFEALAGGERKSPLLIYSDHFSDMKGMLKVNLTIPKCREEIKGVCLDMGIKLLVLDNLSCLVPVVDENSKEDWDPLNQWLLELRFKGVSVVFLHHTNKGGGQRGTSGREDSLDTSIFLLRPPGYSPEDRAFFFVTFTKNRGDKDRHLSVDMSFRLRGEGES
jgi:putative DNA primase/helicase